MTRTQRILLIVTALLAACLLHGMICDWVYRSEVGALVPFLTHTHRGASSSDWRMTGVVYQLGVLGQAQGLLWGIIVPLSLLAFALLLTLGWLPTSPGAQLIAAPPLVHRLVLVATLLICAWLLHVDLCEWLMNSRFNRGKSVIFSLPPLFTQEDRFSGLVLERAVDRAIGVVLGVVTPMVCLAATAFLCLHWRRQSRLERGLCTHCGHDLRGTPRTPGTRCPECGAPGPE